MFLYIIIIIFFFALNKITNKKYYYYYYYYYYFLVLMFGMVEQIGIRKSGEYWGKWGPPEKSGGGFCFRLIQEESPLVVGTMTLLYLVITYRSIFNQI